MVMPVSWIHPKKIFSFPPFFRIEEDLSKKSTGSWGRKKTKLSRKGCAFWSTTRSSPSDAAQSTAAHNIIGQGLLLSAAHNIIGPSKHAVPNYVVCRRALRGVSPSFPAHRVFACRLGFHGDDQVRLAMLMLHFEPCACAKASCVEQLLGLRPVCLQDVCLRSRQHVEFLSRSRPSLIAPQLAALDKMDCRYCCT